MKKVIVFISLVSLFVSCARERDFFYIERDCTGTYLRKDNAEWKVCNPEKLTLFNTWQQVQVHYNPVEVCDTEMTPDTSCSVIHNYQGSMEIISVE